MDLLIQAARNSEQVTPHAFSPDGRNQNYVALWPTARWMHIILSGSVMRALPHKMQASATTLLCEFEQQRDFSRPIASRASRVLGPISRRRVTQVLPAIWSACRATRPRLAVWIIRVFFGIVCVLRLGGI